VEKERQELLKTLVYICGQAPTSVKIIIASRNEVDLQRQLGNEINCFVDYKDTAKDIHPFIEARVAEIVGDKQLLEGNVSEDLKELMKESLNSKADGMYVTSPLLSSLNR
jgi:hypothetical protein